MIPQNNNFKWNIRVINLPSHTYKILPEKQRIRGSVDGIEAVCQAVYKILMTERYAYIIYDWNYGIELKDLFGRGLGYVKTVIADRIKDALCIDDRIEEIYDFEYFNISSSELGVKFKIRTIFGENSMKFTYVDKSL